jgi:hypothetical protein
VSKEIERDGNVKWWPEFRWHSTTLSDGREEWFVIQPSVLLEQGAATRKEDGHHHREGGAAVLFPDGGQLWYQKGCLHREGGPAVIDPPVPGGSILWYEGGDRQLAPGEPW